jgi:signal transduction histidine kinase/ligand-binding sensor domain-containing protein
MIDKAFMLSRWLITASLLWLAITPARADASPAGASPDDFLVRQWTSEHGLPQNSILDIVQTRDGYLWLATFGGLVRFNGQDFVTFDETTPGLAANRFLALYEDAQGRLWIGTQYSGVFVLEDGQFRRCAPAQGCPEGLVNDISASPAGDLWFSTDRGLFARRGEQLHPLYPLDHVNKVKPEVAMSRQGDLWAFSPEGLLRLQGDRMAPAQLPPLPDVPRGIALLDAVPVVKTVGNIYILRNNQWEVIPAPTPYLPAATWLFRFLHVDDHGNLWTDHNGDLWLRSPAGQWRAAVRVAALQRGMQSEHTEFTAFFMDREGSAWIGTNRLGLLQVQPLPLTRFFGPGETMAGYSLTSDGQGGVIAGANCRDLIHIDHLGLKKRETMTGQEGCIDAVLRDRQGRLWVATQREVWRRDGERWLRLWSEDRPDAGHPNVLFERPDEGLLVGVRHRGLFEEGPDGALRPAAWAQGLPSDRLRALAQSPDGALWVGSDDGLARLHEGRWQTWSEAEGAPPGSLRALWVDERGVLWVGSYGGGLGRFDGHRWTRYSAQDGLHENVVSFIAPDRDGGLWLNGNRGLSRVLRHDLDALASGAQRQLQARGLPSGEGNGGVQPTGWMSPDGVLWVPTIYGPVRINTARPLSDAPPPLASIERARFGDLPPTHSPRGLLQGPQGERTLTVDFVGLTSLHPQRPLLKHRLVPFDDHWSAPEQRTRATWAALPPGQYRLEVLARNAEGRWGEPAAIDIFIPAYFYETRWFQMGAALALLGLALAFHRWRLALRDQRHQALQREIHARQEAQDAQRDLAERLQRAERLEVLGRLAGGIAHDFNNLLAALQGAAQLQRLDLRRARLDAAREHNDLILECVRRASRMTSSLLAFGRRPSAPARPVELHEATAQMSKLLQRLLKDSVLFDLALPDEPRWVLIDPGQLDRVLLNLCLNANDAMPRGGRLSLRVVAGDPEARAGDWLTLWVEDTGVGMDQETRRRLFDPFFTTRAGAGGTGLGLAVVVDAVQQAQGYITVQSAPGEGTRFAVSLPRLAQEPPAQPARARTPSGELDRAAHLILLCDDDPSVLQTVSETLRHLGYQVRAAAHMGACLHEAAALAQPPDLLITDVVMPDGDGPSLARALRAQCPDLPVLFISGYTADLDLGELDLASTAFLQKPFSLADLERAVKALLGHVG